MSEEEAGSSLRPADAAIEKLTRQLRSSLFDRVQVDDSLENLVEIGSRYGFTDRQATLLAQLALRGILVGSRKARNQIAARLLKAIHPAKDVQFGQEFVLTILGSLGTSEDTLVDDNENFKQALTDPDGFNSDTSRIDSDDDDKEEIARKRGKVKIDVQASALKLLVLLLCPVQHILEDIDELQGGDRADMRLPTSFLSTKARRLMDKSYSILFHYIDFSKLRPYVCHLLHALTRRKHVRQYRIATLLILRKASPTDVSLDLLITKYSQYSPQLQLSAISVSSSNSKSPRYPDPSWLLTVSSIWSESERVTAPRFNDSLENDDGGPNKCRKINGIPVARKKVVGQSNFAHPRRMLPEATFHLAAEGKLLVTEVMSYRELGYMLDRIQLPDHLVYALEHHMTRIAILAQGDTQFIEEAFSRISRWAISTVDEEIHMCALSILDQLDDSSRSISSRQKSKSLIHSLAIFVEMSGYIPLHLQQWTISLLRPKNWSTLSEDEKKAILKLYESFLPLQWPTFLSQVLCPLTDLLAKAPATESAYLLTALRRMLEYWLIGHDWAEMLRLLQKGKVSYIASNKLDPSIDYIETISETINAAVNQSASLLLRFPNSIDVMDACLSFYESIFSSPFVGMLSLPLPPRFAFNLMTTSQYGSINSLSRMSAILKQILDLHVENIAEEEMSGSKSREMPSLMKEACENFYSDDSRDVFNGCTEHLFGLIWRGDAFSGAIEMGDFDTGIPSTFFVELANRCYNRGQKVGKIGSISHGAVLGPLMEEHANTLGNISKAMIRGPITAYGLNQANKGNFPTFEYRRFRHRHVDWLGEQAAIGLRDFFHATFDQFGEGDSSRGQSRDQSTVHDYSEV